MNRLKAIGIIVLFLSAAMTAQAQGKKSATAQNIEKQGFVNVKEVCPSIYVSLMYSRPDNFTGRVLYTDLREAYLHPQAAKAVARAQQILQKSHPELSLKIYDAARPMHIQQKMWNAVAGTKKNIYVSNPAHGGGLHNYGLAVDITLCNAITGDSIPMGTKVDYLGKYAHIDAEEDLVRRHVMSREALQNRQLLRRVMREAGFKPLRTEWWHFNFKTRAEAKAHYKVIR